MKCLCIALIAWPLPGLAVQKKTRIMTKQILLWWIFTVLIRVYWDFMQQYIHREGPDTLERRDKLRWTLGHWASAKSRERLAWGDRGDTHFTALYNHYFPVGLRPMWPLCASTVNSLVNMWLSQITWTNTAISVHSSCLENIKPDSHACPGNEVVRHALCCIHTLTYAGIHLINRMWPLSTCPSAGIAHISYTYSYKQMIH